jgi:hypothetical protein
MQQAEGYIAELLCLLLAPSPPDRHVSRSTETCMRNRQLLLSAACCALLLQGGCKTAVEPSPEPGILRVMLKGADADTRIIIQGDTSRFSRWDNFNLVVNQGRAYQSDNYVYVYNNPTSARKSSDTVNILAREWLNGVPITPQDSDSITTSNSRFRNYVIFESYVPPGTYMRFTFIMTASEMEIFIPKHYLNPVSLPPGTTPSIDLPASFSVSEQGVTEIQLELSPYASLTRYQDQFYFQRNIVITGIQQQ